MAFVAAPVSCSAWTGRLHLPCGPWLWHQGKNSYTHLRLSFSFMPMISHLPDPSPTIQLFLSLQWIRLRWLVFQRQRKVQRQNQACKGKRLSTGPYPERAPDQTKHGRHWGDHRDSKGTPGSRPQHGATSTSRARSYATSTQTVPFSDSRQEQMCPTSDGLRPLSPGCSPTHFRMVRRRGCCKTGSIM